MRGKNLILVLVYGGFTLGLSWWLGQQAYQWLPLSAAQEAEPVGDLFSFLVTLGSLTFLWVAGFLLYSIIFYRFNLNNPEGAPIRGNARLEIAWTITPILLVTWIAIYNYQIYQRMQILGPLPIVETPQAPTLMAAADSELLIHSRNLADSQQLTSALVPVAETIEVIAKQWQWEFRYPEANVTSSELHLPVNRRVTLNLTSLDVIHGFYVPNFRIKQDIEPNQIIQFSFTPNRIGQYTLHDSQFSGMDFAIMTAPVVVQSPADYQAWLTKQSLR